MWKYVFWWLGPGSDQYPCHLLCWINLIYHLNDLPAQFGRVTGNANNFSFHNIHMIGMPFQTWLLDLKFENDRVTCFGNRTVMNCFSFEPGSGQYMPNTSKHPNHLSSQISTGWMHLEIKAALHCLLSFPECHFHTDVLHSHSPHAPILTKHQAFAPSGPMLLTIKRSSVRAEFCFRASANAWQETHDLRNTTKHTARIPSSCKMFSHPRLFFKLGNTTTYWQENDPFLAS